MKQNKSIKFNEGDILSFKQIFDNDIESLTEDEFNDLVKDYNNSHDNFLNKEEWRKHIIWKPISVKQIAVKIEDDKYQIKEIKIYSNNIKDLVHCQNNLDNLFKYHPLLNSFRYNKFTQKNEFNNMRYDEDKQPAEIFNFFKRNFNEWCPRTDIKESIQETLNNNEYHPIIDYLNNIIWDGTERLETFLIDYYNAKDNKLNRVYFKRWMIALIKRIMIPGSKFDSMLILAGEQGKKKTSLFNWLGTIDNITYYSEAPDNLKDINSLVYTSMGKFIITFDDFDDICNKGDLGKVKSFITTQDRTAALKWQHDKQYPITYVLAATTNQYNILVDDATFDERRFWVVEVNPSDDVFDLPEELKEQLYAEAYYLYQQDPDQRLWIWEKELKEEEIELQKQFKRAAEDPLTEKIMSIFNRKYPIVNGKFDDYRHFMKCMEKYNPIYNKEIKDVDLLNASCERDNDMIGSQWGYVTNIPSAWIIELFALGKRSTDRIVQIIHTQNLNASKKPRQLDYGVQLTHIWVSR
jgi:predicted P-loop ATPase